MVIPKVSSSIANTNCKESIRFNNLIDQQYHLLNHQHYQNQPYNQLVPSPSSSALVYHNNTINNHFNSQQISKLNHLPIKNRPTVKSSSSVNTFTTMIDASEDLLLSYGADQSTPSPPPPPPSQPNHHHHHHHHHHLPVAHSQASLQPPPLPPPPPPPSSTTPQGGINLTISSSLSSVNQNVSSSGLVNIGKRINKRRVNLIRGGETGNGTGESVGDSTLLACLVCGKNFVSFGRLKSHEKTHSKSRPFKCIDCGKTFTVRYSLICHTRVHTRERPYGCSYCGSRFSQASSLKTHQIYKHTKEFPYLCKYCGRGFISPGQKHEHIQRTHLKSSSFSSAVSTSSLSSSSPSSSSSSSSSSTSSHVDCHLSRFKTCRPLVEPSIQRSHGPKMATTSVQTDIRLPPSLIY